MYFNYRYHGTSFEQTYRCYPASFIDKLDSNGFMAKRLPYRGTAITIWLILATMAPMILILLNLIVFFRGLKQSKSRKLTIFTNRGPHIENGDKIIMPPSALDRLASLHIDYPMLFELRNAFTDRVSHCGVLEFIADEGMIYMPYWMMENLLLKEGDAVHIKNVTLPKGTYVKLQPHTSDFLNISNPKAILETTLRNFSCLTTGDSIMVAYNNKKYYIDIIESKPSSAITIIETDCEVDFAPPLDYKEPDRPASVPSSKTPAEDQAALPEELKFNPFMGSGRRLDGKPLKYQAPPVSSDSGCKGKQPAVSGGSGQLSTGSTSQSGSCQSQGKLVFGSNTNRSAQQKEVVKETKQAQPLKEEPKFQAFTGKKYSLKG